MNMILMMLLLIFPQVAHANKTSYCTTAGCKYVSYYLSLMVNRTADPCDNFYEFACGAYLDITKDETDEAMLSLASISDEIINNATHKGLMNVNVKSKKTLKAFKYARRYFDSCSDYDPTEETSQQEVVDYLISFANWPFLNKRWQANKFDVVKLVGKLQGQLSLPTIVSLMVDVDRMSNNRNTLYLKEGTLLYASVQYNETIFPDFTEEYVDVVSKALQQLVINAKVTHHTVRSINKVAEAIVKFEADLAANIIPDSEVNEDDITKFYHPYTVTELNNVYNSSSVWSRYFQAALGNDTKSLGWLYENKIVVTQLDYFKYLAHKFYSTPTEVVGNYLMWRLLVKLGPYFDQNFLQVGITTEEEKRLRRHLLDKPSPIKKESSDCLTETNRIFEHVAARFYVDKRYNSAKHKSALNMTEQILNGAKKIFVENKWLSTEAKRRVFAKLDNLVTNIGYPKWILNDSLLNQFYKSYRIRANSSYFVSQLQFKRFDLSDLYEPVDRHKFIMPVVTPNNAAYMPVTNALSVPAGQLERPFFDSDYPDFYKLAVVGQTMGHEIFHGFDNVGALYDENGNASDVNVEENRHWLLADCDDKFQNLTECLVDDYSRYCYNLPDFSRNKTQTDEDQSSTADATEEPTQLISNCINGEKTLAENIADLDGLKAAYFAFKDLYKQIGYRRLTQFGEFTSDQMYFISYASQFCARISSQLKVVQIFLTDDHSPHDARVNALLRNFPEFREAFNCPSSSYMYSNNNKNICTLY